MCEMIALIVGPFRPQTTQTSYLGKLMVNIITQSLRMAITVQAKRREIQELKLPDNSVEKLLTALKREHQQELHGSEVLRYGWKIHL